MPSKRAKYITLQHNKEIAAIFHHMADCYKYLGPDEKFRAIAYETASKTISNMKEPIDIYGHDLAKLDELKGVGEHIAEKIIEYLDNGSIKAFERLKKRVPYQLLDLMDIEGFGPATIRLLHDTLHVFTKEEIKAAVDKGQLKGIKGFGEKKINSLLSALKLNTDAKLRMPLKEAEMIGKELLTEIKRIPSVKQASLAGSLRRRSETVGDIDIVVTAERRYWKKIILDFIKLALVDRVLASGETKASVILKYLAVQADLRVVHESEYGSAMLYFTGSKEHNIILRTVAKRKGWKINEYGVFDRKTNKRLAGKTEESIYNLFGLDYIPPEKRLGKQELNSITQSGL